MRRLFLGLWLVVSAPFRLVFWLVSLPFGLLLRLSRHVHHFLTVPLEDRPLAESFSDVVRDTEVRSSLWQHIEDLRRHLLRSILYLVIATGISFFFTERLVNFLAQLVGGLDSLRAIEVTESVGVFMRVALLSGALFAVPFIAFEFWLFVASGLMPRTRQISLIFIPLAGIFFAAGIFVAYYFLLPPALNFLLDFMGIQAELRPQAYYTFVTGLLFWVGIIFEFPLVVFVLTWLGVIQPRMLVAQWRFAIVIIALLAAIITPTTDPVNMGLLMLPMTLLYFVSIGMSYLARAMRRNETNQASA